jgi:hypothetical protein
LYSCVLQPSLCSIPVTHTHTLFFSQSTTISSQWSKPQAIKRCCCSWRRLHISECWAVATRRGARAVLTRKHVLCVQTGIFKTQENGEAKISFPSVSIITCSDDCCHPWRPLGRTSISKTLLNVAAPLDWLVYACNARDQEVTPMGILTFASEL